MQQLTFDLSLPPRYGRDDYLVSTSNAAALAMIDRWPDWPDSVMILVGPKGAGKSHLAALWAADAKAMVATADLLSGPDLPTLPTRPVLIDDADQLGSSEAQLFHLMNLVREQHSALLLTALQPPDRWGLATPDLLSRLRLAPMVRIEPPDDDLMRAVLIKLFADRQLTVDEQVVAYLLLQLDRSIDAARRVVEVLDQSALSLNRKVTRAMAAKLLESNQADEDNPLDHDL
ncbi:DnaA ATPase domain-containing protein [Lichenihabitans psoromatis]|uniref:DnaA ATPase domain-containing protein n=1 Tax=Lichenihabitans psoromatis TaxID=2528642 RepID=UPI00103647F0|nr:DnaA/Hda family protein [Lichenihabitans psoromatis]